MKKAKVCITAALSALDRGIGKNGDLLWHISEDLKRFKQLTLGHPVIMGRKTYESVAAYVGGPLPNRTNIVVTRSGQSFEGCLVFDSLEKALETAHGLDNEEVHIGGGAQIYEAALPYADRLYLTLIDGKKDADTFFPDFSEFKTEIHTEDHPENDPPYSFVTFEK